MMDLLINFMRLCVGGIFGVVLMCVVITGADDSSEHHITNTLQKHELKEHDWYWNDEHKKYYQIASNEEVSYAFNTINPNCVYVVENERIKPLFYVFGAWFKYRESVVK